MSNAKKEQLNVRISEASKAELHKRKEQTGSTYTELVMHALDFYFGLETAHPIQAQLDEQSEALVMLMGELQELREQMRQEADASSHERAMAGELLEAATLKEARVDRHLRKLLHSPAATSVANVSDADLTPQKISGVLRRDLRAITDTTDDALVLEHVIWNTAETLPDWLNQDPSGVAKSLGLNKPVVASSIDRLQAKGFIEVDTEPFAIRMVRNVLLETLRAQGFDATDHTLVYGSAAAESSSAAVLA